jgi:hypothetical protein
VQLLGGAREMPERSDGDEGLQLVKFQGGVSLASRQGYEGAGPVVLPDPTKRMTPRFFLVVRIRGATRGTPRRAPRFRECMPAFPRFLLAAPI